MTNHGAPDGRRREMLPRLRVLFRELHFGGSPADIRVGCCVLAIDLLLIAFFIFSPFLKEFPGDLAVDYLVALMMAVEVTVRGRAYDNLRVCLRKPATLIDLFVLASLLLPFWLFTLAYLRPLLTR